MSEEALPKRSRSSPGRVSQGPSPLRPPSVRALGNLTGHRHVLVGVTGGGDRPIAECGTTSRACGRKSAEPSFQDLPRSVGTWKLGRYGANPCGCSPKWWDSVWVGAMLVASSAER